MSKITVNSLSPSTVKQFTEGCPEQVFLDKIDKVPRKGISAAALMGSGFHSVAESYYRALMLGHKLDVATLYRVFEARWNLVNQSEIIFGKQDLEALLAKVKELIALLVEAEPPKEILAVELGLTYSLTNDLDVLGTPDLVYRDSGGVLTIADIKTSAKAYGPDEIYAATQQTYAYAMSYDEPVKLKLFLFIKTKVPRFEVIELDARLVDHEEWENRFLMTKKGLETGIRYRVRSWACKTCSFNYICNESQNEKPILSCLTCQTPLLM